jgi:hypothetical protein
VTSKGYGALVYKGETNMVPHARGNTDDRLRMTVDHAQIQEWVEERGGRPAIFNGEVIEDQDGVLRIDFHEHTAGQTLEPISWQEFFEQFEQQGLAFVYQDETSGDVPSRYFRFTRRGTNDIAGHI